MRPIPKQDKGVVTVTAYRPVTLTSCGCKLLERVALRRMEAIAAEEEAIPEQLTDFRRHRAAIDSMADVAAALEHATASKQVAAIVLLDVKGTFDNLQRHALSGGMEEAGISDMLQGFVEAFLTGRTEQV